MNNKSLDRIISGFHGFKIEVFKCQSDKEKEKKEESSDYFRRLPAFNNTKYLQKSIKRFY